MPVGEVLHTKFNFILGFEGILASRPRPFFVTTPRSRSYRVLSRLHSELNLGVDLYRQCLHMGVLNFKSHLVFGYAVEARIIQNSKKHRQLMLS